LPSSPPPILVAALALLATRALVILASYAAYLRWRARRTLKALLCAAGLGRAEGDAAAPDPADDEPEVEDVESVAAGLLPPAEHVHDYGRVADLLRACRRRGEEEEEEEEEDADRRRSAPASASDSDETDGARDFVDPLRRLCLPPAGYSNSGNTCFAASALQCLYHTRALTAHFADPEASHECPRGDGGSRPTSNRRFCVTCEYRDLVRRSLVAKPRGREPIGALTNSIGKIARHFVRGRQEDSHEYIRSLLDAMHVGYLKEHAGEDAEKALDPRTQETTLVYHIFGGYTCGRVVCGSCGHESRTYQSALDFPIEVAAGRGQAVSSLAAAMRRNFVDTETLDGANKYKCGGCRAYVKAERGSKIHVSPNTLVVPVKRYQLGRAGKITKFVEYPATLDLSPYMSDDAPYEGAPGDDASAPVYDLYGVLVHLDFMGSAHSGHYVAFVRLASGTWFKCDDGNVEKTTAKTALAQKAYLLFYERRAPRAAPPARTRAQQARVETLKAAEAARAERVATRRRHLARHHSVAGSPSSGIASSRDANGTRTRRREPPVKVPEYVVKVSGARKETSSNVATEDATDDENDSAEISEASETSEASDSDVTVLQNVAALHRRPWPAKITVTVKLPGVASASALRVEMTDAAVSVATKKKTKKKTSSAYATAPGDAYALDVVLPFPVDDDDASVVFDSRARVLTVVAPVRLYTAARARAHAAFLRRAAREEKRKIKSASSDAASSDSDWVETDGEARQSSDSDSDDALAEDMGAMGLAASPTRARAR
jgi:ubiquitin carboxyl-terminal hydrolase 36/42